MHCRLVSFLRFPCSGVHGFLSFSRRVFRVAKGASWALGTLFFLRLSLVVSAEGTGWSIFRDPFQNAAQIQSFASTKTAAAVAREEKKEGSAHHHTILFILLNIIQSRTGNEPGWGPCREFLTLEGFSGVLGAARINKQLDTSRFWPQIGPLLNIHSDTRCGFATPATTLQPITWAVWSVDVMRRLSYLAGTLVNLVEDRLSHQP